MNSIPFWIFLMSASFIHYTVSDSDWTKQCNICSCIWVSGRRTANCSNKGFNRIPDGLSNLVREIDFSNNALYSLADGEFISANLLDIHKLKFQNCSIEVMDEGAFRRLALIIELDLSRNSIVELKSNTFRDNVKLRILTLSYNKIRTLEEGLFSNMSFVQRIHVDHNEIEHINENTFYNLPLLTDISLGYNRLKTVAFDLKERLPKLNSLNVEENPWICDCRLELFHQSLMKNNLITHATKCEEPLKFKGRLWTLKESFPCSPTILHPLPAAQIMATSSNITLVCKVLGEPEPDVDWINNGHIIEKDPRKNKQKYFNAKSRFGEYTWNNLTIINLSYKDRGDYKCLAKNPGGEDERAISLLIDNEVYLSGTGGGFGGAPLLIITLSVGLIVLLIIILILVCLFCRKAHNRSQQQLKRNDLNSSSEECISMGGHGEIKKGIMTDVNPICKPPRSSVPASVVSGGTEVSDAKRNLLDNESVFDLDDESRSFDFDQPLIQKTRNGILDSDYRHHHNHYPPDLLSFPARTQISPAPSTASTIMMDRLPPPHGPQSPVHNPIYDQLSIYKTLPYSRSHSPFTVGMPRIPRQGVGYVTIPRRPRQSWSSEPPPSSEVIGEPLYDNLGTRSTVDGSSALSLNKIGTDSASTPRSNRLLPLTPLNIGPIVESHELPHVQESARSSSPQPSTIRRQSPSPHLEMKPKAQPLQNLIGSQTLPRNLNSHIITHHLDDGSQPKSPNESRNSISNDGSMYEKGKPKKIPPRPPPKPKKRVSSGPLLEDEGEDGTEV